MKRSCRSTIVCAVDVDKVDSAFMTMEPSLRTQDYSEKIGST